MRRTLALAMLTLLLAGCAGSAEDAADAEDVEDPTDAPDDAHATSGGEEGTPESFEALGGMTPVGRAVYMIQQGMIQGRWEIILNRSAEDGVSNHIYYDPAAHLVIMEMWQRGDPDAVMLINHTSVESEDGVTRVSHDGQMIPFAGQREDTMEIWDPRFVVVSTLMGSVIYGEAREEADDAVDGVPAKRYTFTGSVVWIEKASTGRLLRYELQGSQPATVLIRYGEPATHARLAEIMVLEGMAFYEKADHLSVVTDLQEEMNYTWTLRESDATRVLPLSDLKARGTGNGANLTLPLDAGSKEDARLRLTFSDVDGDGNLTPGDTLRAESLVSRRTLGSFDIVVEHASGISVTLA